MPDFSRPNSNDPPFPTLPDVLHSPLLLLSEHIESVLSPVETLLTLLRRFVGVRPYVCARGFFWDDDAATEAEEVEEDDSRSGIVMERVGGGRGVEEDASAEGEEREGRRDG